MPDQSEHDRIAERAAFWVARLRAPAIDFEERAAFAEWLAEAPEHKRAFDEMLELWDVLGALDALPEQPAFTVVEAKRPRAAARGPGRAGRAPEGPRAAPTPAATHRHARRSPRRTHRRGWLAAAAIVLAIAMTWLLQPGGERLETAVGEIERIALADGSVLDLNSNSAVRVDVGASRRVIRLERGEAHFDVAHDPARPFVVQTEHGEVRAVGTAFAVRRLDAETLVLVTSGVVDAAGTRLSAGESARFDGGRTTTGTVPPHALGWRDRRLVYDGVSIGALVADLNRYVPVHMTVASEDLAAERVSASLRIGSQQAMLEALGTSVALRWSQVSDNLIIIDAAR